MQPCLSQTLTLQCSFLEDVQHFAAAGAQAMVVWLTKLEQAVAAYGLERLREALGQRQLRAVAAAGQGGLFSATGEQRRLAFDQFQKRLGLCQALGIETVIVACDFPHIAEAGDWEQALRQLQLTAQLAASYQIRLALEPQGRAAFCASLDTLVRVVESCGEANVGVNLDVFQYYIGPSKPEDLALLTASNLFFVELSDLAGIPREWALDRHRILPGDGEFHLQPILDHLRRIGYRGYVAVEAPNPDFWSMNPVRVAETALRALERLLQTKND
jgi:2-keto-myo-inositol isomerase